MPASIRRFTKEGREKTYGTKRGNVPGPGSTITGRDGKGARSVSRCVVRAARDDRSLGCGALCAGRPPLVGAGI